MRVLELFSGTGSVGKCCESLGYEVVSVDMILPATHIVDIMNFDYKQYPKNHFDIVWASPPCIYYSKLQDCNFGRTVAKGEYKGEMRCRELNNKQMDDADKLVLKALEIIEYFNPHWWYIENPQTGRLKEREIMKGLPFHDADYCRYSDYGYRKRTRFWTNRLDLEMKKCNGVCGNMFGGRHIVSCDGGKSDLVGTTQKERYRIPPDVIYELIC